MLEDMIKSVITKVISGEYPHLSLPGLLTARIMRRIDKDGYYEYTLRILDDSGEPDSRFPEIPEVLCREKYETGARVAAGLLYGALDPFILGEVVEI